MKTNSPTYSTLALCVIGALSSGAADKANAFQLGQLQQTNRIGEPLDAYINLLMSPTESLRPTEVAVIPDFSHRNDPLMNAALESVRAEMVRTEYGHHYIKLSSDSELNVPLLAFRIKAINGDNLLIRNFAIAPKPALPVATQRPGATGRSRDRFIATAPRRASQASVAPQPAVTRQVPANQSATGEYGPVQAGDTLWRIATRVAGGQAGAILNELFVLNPHAFIDGDINKLRQGVTLRLPNNFAAPPSSNAQLVDVAVSNAEDTADTTETKPTVAKEFVFEEPANGRHHLTPENNELENTKVASTRVTDANAAESIEINTPDNVTFSTASVTPQDWRQQNPELAERLQSLGEKYAALRERYAEQQNEPSVEAPAPTQTVEPTKTLAPEDTVADLSVTAENNTEIVSANSNNTAENSSPTSDETAADNSTANNNEPSVAPATAVSSAHSSRFDLPIWLLGLIGLGVIAGGAAIYFLQTRRAASARLQEQMARAEKDNSLKEEMAKKAQHRVKMEGDVERMLMERTVDDSADEIEKTMKLEVAEVLPAEAEEIELDLGPDDSPEHQINDSIAHGRYGEAEELLRQVIADSPRNFSAKLRLAEVFYITERIDEFVEISQDIHANHRADISDEDWRRVMRMGKMIAPEQPPFSGPQSIIEDASAG